MATAKLNKRREIIKNVESIDINVSVEEAVVLVAILMNIAGDMSSLRPYSTNVLRALEEAGVVCPENCDELFHAPSTLAFKSGAAKSFYDAVSETAAL